MNSDNNERQNTILKLFIFFNFREYFTKSVPTKFVLFLSKFKEVQKENPETERLKLKPANLEDAAFFLKLYNEPLFIKNIGDRNLKTISDAENYIKEKFLPQYEKFGFGNYVMIRKSDSMKVGAVGIFIREGFEIPDIGFSLLEEFYGEGFAFEAANRLKEFASNNFELNRLAAMTTTSNLNSQKLIEKLGLKYIRMVEFPGDDELLRYYENELL